MMSYWNCVIRARAPTLLLWTSLQAGILYTIYNQKRHEKFIWKSSIPKARLNMGRIWTLRGPLAEAASNAHKIG